MGNGGVHWQHNDLFLSGVMFSNICLTRRESIQWWDPLVLGLLALVRGVMVGVCWLPLKWLHPATDDAKLKFRRVGVVMIWSGLRGAVGLALAIMVDAEPGISKRHLHRRQRICGWHLGWRALRCAHRWHGDAAHGPA